MKLAASLLPKLTDVPEKSWPMIVTFVPPLDRPRTRGYRGDAGRGELSDRETDAVPPEGIERWSRADSLGDAGARHVVDAERAGAGVVGDRSRAGRGLGEGDGRARSDRCAPKVECEGRGGGEAGEGDGGGLSAECESRDLNVKLGGRKAPRDLPRTRGTERSKGGGAGTLDGVAKQLTRGNIARGSGRGRHRRKRIRDLRGAGGGDRPLRCKGEDREREPEGGG